MNTSVCHPRPLERAWDSIPDREQISQEVRFFRLKHHENGYLFPIGNKLLAEFSFWL